MIPALGRLRPEERCEVEASLGCRVSSTPAKLHSETLSPKKKSFEEMKQEVDGHVLQDTGWKACSQS